MKDLTTRITDAGVFSHTRWRGGRLLPFLKGEIKGLFLVFWRAFWKVTAGTTALFFVVALLVVLGDETLPPLSSWLFIVPVLLAYCLFYALWVGLSVGAVRIAWRLCGGWIIVPVLIIPASVAFTVWLCSGSTD